MHVLALIRLRAATAALAAVVAVAASFAVAPAAVADAQTTGAQTGDTRTAGAQPSGTTVRLAGDSRFDTAVAISRDLFDDGGARAAVLVLGTGFADALSGTVIARAVRGPLLLTNTDVLPAATRAELDRVLVDGGAVVLIGGTGVISDGVAGTLSDLGYDVRRIAGASRFETAVRSAAAIPSPRAVFLADGHDFTDGLVASTIAAQTGGVLLLTAGDTIDPHTAEHLATLAHLPQFAIGAPAAAAVADATPIAGRTPGHTSRLVAEAFHAEPAVVGVASNRDFPDGLAGGLHMAMRGGPLLLTGPDDLDVPVLGYLDHLDVAGTLAGGYVYGGSAALADPVLERVQEQVAGATRTIHSAVPGLCLDLPGTASTEQIVERSCEADHEYEVYAVFDHPSQDPTHPGRSQVESDAGEECTGDRFTEYVGVEYAESRLFVRMVTPTESGWEQGDRQIVCMVYDIRGPKNRSVYGSAE